MLIAVGRLVPIKRFEHLIAACAVLRATSAAEPRLIIVGDGSRRDSLQSAARRAGVALELPGWVPREQLATWLHAADVFAQTSTTLPSGRTEGMPLAILEALAVGLPVVATDQAGLRELAVRHQSMVLVAGADCRALAAELARFCVKD
jgi:glycosyltransferase involved in cell wall biosynthesis